MKFVDELRYGKEKIEFEKTSEFERITSQVQMAIRRECENNRIKRGIEGYIFFYKDDGYDEVKIVPKLPECDAIKDTKERNKLIKEKRYTRGGNGIFYREEINYPYRGFGIFNDFNKNSKLVENLKKEINDWGFTQYNVRIITVKEFCQRITPSKIFEKVKVTYAETGKSIHSIYVSLKW